MTRVGRDRKTGADFAEFGCRFEYGHPESGPLQRQRCRQSTDPGSDEQDMCRLHGQIPSIAGVSTSRLRGAPTGATAVRCVESETGLIRGVQNVGTRKGRDQDPAVLVFGHLAFPEADHGDYDTGQGRARQCGAVFTYHAVRRDAQESEHDSRFSPGFAHIRQYLRHG